MSDLNSLRELMLRNGLVMSMSDKAASSEIIPFFDDTFGGGDEGTDGINDCHDGCKEGCKTSCLSGCTTCSTGGSTPR